MVSQSSENLKSQSRLWGLNDLAYKSSCSPGRHFGLSIFEALQISESSFSSSGKKCSRNVNRRTTHEASDNDVIRKCLLWGPYVQLLASAPQINLLNCPKA